MAVAASSSSPDLLDLRSAALTLVSLVLRSPDLQALQAELARRSADNPGLFDHDPVALDLAALRDADAPLDFAALIALLRSHGMVAVAARGGSEQQMADARAAGLVEAPELVAPRAARAAAAPAEIVREVIREVQVPVEVQVEVPAPVQPTLIDDRPLRSGQQVYARGADLVVLAVVSFGAEVIADGHIHVYAPLRGRALAGARGNTDARIFSTCMEPQLVSIAGIYRTSEVALAADIAGRAAQVRLDGERLVFEPLAR